METKPKLGQLVHYHDHSGKTLAAFVTRVWSTQCVNLLVLDDGSAVLGGHTSSYVSVSKATTYGTPGFWSPEPGETVSVKIERLATPTLAQDNQAPAQVPAIALPPGARGGDGHGE